MSCESNTDVNLVLAGLALEVGGARALQAHWGDRIRHVYAPIDTPGAVARFLNRLQPRLLILVERELWPEWLQQCRANAVPVAPFA